MSVSLDSAKSQGWVRVEGGVIRDPAMLLLHQGFC